MKRRRSDFFSQVENKKQQKHNIETSTCCVYGSNNDNKKHQEKTLKAKVKANIISLTWSPKTRDLEIKNILEKSLRCPQQGVGSLSSQQPSTTFTAMINLDVFAVVPKQRATHASKYTCLNRFLFRVAPLDSTIKMEIWKLVKTRNLF